MTVWVAEAVSVVVSVRVSISVLVVMTVSVVVSKIVAVFGTAVVILVAVMVLVIFLVIVAFGNVVVTVFVWRAAVLVDVRKHPQHLGRTVRLTKPSNSMSTVGRASLLRLVQVNE